MHVDISSTLSCTYEQAVTEVQATRLLQYVARPIVHFSPVGKDAFPPAWTVGTHWVNLWLFGVLPLGRQAIVISFPPVASGFALRDAGHSALIPTWDHLITIEQGKSAVVYRDRVEIRAGILTPFVWLFAEIFYRHRQRRWKKLVESEFDFGAAQSNLQSRDSRCMRVPPVLMLFGAVGLSVGLASIDPLAQSILGLRALGVMMAIAGLATALAGVLAFRRQQTTVDPRYPERASTLVADGVYRWTRNPMYVGFVCVAIGAAVALGSLFALAGPGVLAMYLDRVQVPAEERALQERFGASFEHYALSVRRWAGRRPQ